jgi:hypothetical protein
MTRRWLGNSLSNLNKNINKKLSKQARDISREWKNVDLGIMKSMGA